MSEAGWTWDAQFQQARIDELQRESADAQATIEALQARVRGLETELGCPTWVCDCCGRVSSMGWINIVNETMDGIDYDMECPNCHTRQIEEDSAADLVRERDEFESQLTQRTAELEAAKRKVDLAGKKAWLAAHDVGFFSMWNGTDHSGPPKLALLCNDTFAWATSDAEDVLDEQIDTIVELFKSEGEAGVIKWIAQQRNMKPMESVGKWLFGCDAIKKERDDLRAELERVRERVGQRGLEVVMIGKVGHYVSTAVKEELERVKGELVEATHNVNVYQSLYSTSCMDRALLENDLRDIRTLIAALPKVDVVTGDTVVNIVQQYNFHQWMLRALQHRQGMEG